MALQSGESISSRATEALLFLISLFFALAICVPWRPDFATIGMEPSWRLALHYFFEHGFFFGKDIIFTYGPYGFIATYTYHPATYRIMFFAYLFFVTGYTAAGWDILRKGIKNKWVVFCAVLAASLFLAPAPYNYSAGDTFFFSCGILFFASYLAESDKPYRARNLFLVGVLAASSLMKYSFFVWAIGLLAFVSLDRIIFRKKIPFLFLLYWGILIGLWVLAKQPLAGLGTYFLTGAHLARYYGSAMSGSMASNHLSFSFYLVSSFSFVAIFYIGQQRRTGYRAILPALTLAAMAFLIFRAAFTRPDHSSLAMSYLAISGIYWIPFLNETLKAKWWKLYFVGSIIMAFSLAWCYSIKPFTPSFSDFTNKIWTSLAKMPHYTFVESRFLSHPKDLEQLYGDVQNVVRRFNPVPKLSGAVDVFPFECTGVIAQDLSYKPRPIFQAYVTETPFLSQKNADYLKSPSAPEYLVFGPNNTTDGKPVDNRYPTLDDSLSLPEIMSRYDFVEILRANVLLKKNSLPRPYSFQSLKKVTAEFGESIPVPRFDKGPVWVKIDIKLTWRGKIFDFLGRAGRVLITAKALNGIAYTYDLIPVMSQTGFLLSPVLNEPVGFVSFWIRHYENPGLFHKEAVELKLEIPPSFKGFFVPRFKVHFFEFKT